MTEARTEQRTMRCTNCGQEAREVSENTLDRPSQSVEAFPDLQPGGFKRVDQRYGVGYCGGCRLRGTVPLLMSTRAEAEALIAEREDKVLRTKQMQELRVGLRPAHTYSKRADTVCCEMPFKDHLGRERLALLLGILRGER